MNRLPLLLWVLMACQVRGPTADAGPEGPAVCAPDDDGCDPYDEVNFLGTWSTDVCRFLFDCCADVDRLLVVEGLVGQAALDGLLLEEEALLSERDACTRGLALALASTVRNDVAAYLDDRRRFDRDAAAECFGFVRQGADLCAPVLVLAPPELAPPSCARVFAPAVPAAGTCYSDDDCADAAAAYCFPDSGLVDDELVVSLQGSCAALPAEGEACARPGGPCRDGLFCSNISGNCEARAAVGALCAGAPCDDDGTCVVVETPQGPAPVCQPRQIVGALCAADADCVVEAFCDGDTRVCLPRFTPALEDLRFEFCLGGGANRTLADVVDAVVGELP